MEGLEAREQRGLILREVIFFEMLLVVNSDELSFANVLFSVLGDKAIRFFKLPYQLAIIN